MNGALNSSGICYVINSDENKVSLDDMEQELIKNKYKYEIAYVSKLIHPVVMKTTVFVNGGSKEFTTNLVEIASNELYYENGILVKEIDRKLVLALKRSPVIISQTHGRVHVSYEDDESKHPCLLYCIKEEDKLKTVADKEQLVFAVNLSESSWLINNDVFNFYVDYSELNAY
jgi:hypothetical protein